MIDQYITHFVQRITISMNVLLLVVNTFIVTLLVVLWHTGIVMAMRGSVLVFLTVLLFFFALYRPWWAFLFFVGMLPLEAVAVPVVAGIDVRPYQLLGSVLILALIVRAVTGRSTRRVFRWRWWDSAVIIFAIGGFVAAIFANHYDEAFIQAGIVSSFVAWYFLARYFVRGPMAARLPLLFFFTSSSVVVLYGMWQSWQFVHSGIVATMVARPNATFAEPDWFGVFLVFVSALIYGALHAVRLLRYGTAIYNKRQVIFYSILLWGLLFLVYSALIVTVARSAWIGVCVTTVFFIACFLLRRDWRGMLWHGAGIIVGIVGALVIVTVFSFTTFNIGDRVRSVGNGMQMITVACRSADAATALTQRGQIDNVRQLATFGCRHIALEEIVQRRDEGFTITQVMRPDPSHGVRRIIYAKVVTLLIQRSWQKSIFGSGWGQTDLGYDANGTRLNASNVFLEVLVNTGALGFCAFIVLLCSVFWRGIRGIVAIDAQNSLHIYAYFAIIGTIAFIVPNLFNAGILLGFIWVFLGMMAGLRRV